MNVYYVYTCKHILYPPQYGDSAVILATRRRHSDILKELVAAGANLNLKNQVNSGCYWH